jgi:hypothetical protein
MDDYGSCAYRIKISKNGPAAGFHEMKNPPLRLFF